MHRANRIKAKKAALAIAVVVKPNRLIGIITEAALGIAAIVVETLNLTHSIQEIGKQTTIPAAAIQCSRRAP